MAGDPAAALAALVREVRQGRGALLMDQDGVVIEQAAPAEGLDLEAMAGEYAGVLRHARSLAAELDWGSPMTFSVRGAAGHVVFAFGPGDLLLAVAAGPGGLRGQMREALGRVLAHLADA